MLRNEELEERRLFSHDERAAALKRSHNKCACCGKPLTTKTMTMDHVIPISRGGSNDPRNLVALCYDCNQLKGNLLYRPESFYISAVNDSMYLECQNLFHEWFDTIYKDFDLERYPLISPRFVTLFSPVAPTHRMKNLVFSKQFLLEYHLVSQDKDNELAAVTGINVNELRADTNMLMYDKYREQTVAVYAMTKVSSMKYLAVISVLLDREKHHMLLYMPWSDISAKFQPTAMYYFVKFLLESVADYAHERVDMLSLYAQKPDALSYFSHELEQFPLLGIATAQIKTDNVKGIGMVYTVEIMRRFPDHDGPKFGPRQGVMTNIFSSLDVREYLKAESQKREERFNLQTALAEERYNAAHKKENTNHEKRLTDEIQI